MLCVFSCKKVDTNEKKVAIFIILQWPCDHTMWSIFAQLYYTTMVVEWHLLQHIPFACAQLLPLQCLMYLIETNTQAMSSSWCIEEQSKGKTFTNCPYSNWRLFTWKPSLQISRLMWVTCVNGNGTCKLHIKCLLKQHNIGCKSKFHESFQFVLWPPQMSFPISTTPSLIFGLC